MISDNTNIEGRLLALENTVKDLKLNNKETKSTETKSTETKSTETKPKKTRTQTEYNRFVSACINEDKEKLGADFKHKDSFSNAAKKWNEQKLSKHKNN